MRRSVPKIVGFAILVTAAWSLPRSPAHACTIAPPDPTFDGAPANGAIDIPTNVVPIFNYYPTYEESPEGVPGTFVIETSAGEPVTTTARKVGTQWFEIAPEKPLKPNTDYRIRGTWKRMHDGLMFHTQLEFTTGAGPRTGPVPVPVAKLQNLDWQTSVIDSCRPQTQSTCVALQADGIFEEVYIDSFGQLVDEWTTFRKRSFSTTPLTPALQQGTNFRCVRLRRRAIDGAFSDPVVLCGTDAPVYHVADARPVECTDQGLVVPTGAPVRIDPPGTTPFQPGSGGVGAVAGAGAFAGTGSFAVAGTASLAGTSAPAAGAIAMPPATGTAVVADAGAAGAANGGGQSGAQAVSGAANGGGQSGPQAVAGAAGRGGDSRIRIPGMPDKSRHARACSLQPGLTSSAPELLAPLTLGMSALLVRARRRGRVRR